MGNEAKKAIGTKGMVCMIANQILVKLFIGQARMWTNWVGNSAWMLYLAGLFLQLTVFLATVYLYEGAEDKDPIDLAEDTFGIGGRVVVGLLFFVYFMLSFISLFRLYAEALKMILFSDTTIWLAVLLMIICIGIAAHSGLSALADLHSLFVPLAVAIVLIICLMNIKNFEVFNILPIFGKGLKSLGSHVPVAIGSTTEMDMLFLLLPFTQKSSFPKKAGLWALFLGGGISFLMILSYCLSIDYPESTEYLLSMYQLTRLVGLGKSFSRLEGISEFFWILFVLLSLELKLWLSAHILKKTCRLPDQKPIVWSLGFLGLGIAFLPDSLARATDWYMRYFVSGIRWRMFFAPLVIVLLYRMKQRMRGKVLCKKQGN